GGGCEGGGGGGGGGGAGGGGAEKRREGAGGRGGGAGDGGRGQHSPVRGRPLARARSVSGGGHHGGSKPGYWPVGGGPVRAAGEDTRGVNPERGAAIGERDARGSRTRAGGRRVGGLLSPSNISRVRVHTPPVHARRYIYMYIYMHAQTDRSLINH